MNKRNRFSIASSLVLLAIFLTCHSACAQMPKLLLKFVEKHNNVQSGYVKLHLISLHDGDTTLYTEEVFFVFTPKDIKYLSYRKDAFQLSIMCKTAHTSVENTTCENSQFIWYGCYDEIFDAKDKEYLFYFSYPLAYKLSFLQCEDCVYQRIAPKQNKRNIRYKIEYPNDNDNGISNRSVEWEFEKKTFNLVQQKDTMNYFTGYCYNKIDVLDQRLYDYIHPDILDTISFKFEEIKKGYDRKIATEQANKNSVFRAHFCDSIAQSLTKNGAKWIEHIPQKVQKDTLFFMPEWKFPLLSGDSIYSDSIKSQFLLIDTWYVGCRPCMLAMRELSSIDTIYDELLLKMVSLNVMDKDTAKMNKVIKNFNLKCDVACAFDSGYDSMLKKMGECDGYPQLYLIEMKTKQVIWHSCGYYTGFTKDIEKIIIAHDENKN